ncbi:MAG: efflux RND transporter permease subunit [Aquisalinus sp.]|nr:efflux RND transporter permease subunit [Aquisalinus sp.]
MTHLVDIAFKRAKVTLLALALLVFAGVNSFNTIPREADPDVPLPMALIVIPLPGVSPEDAERLLIKPTELELQSLEGVTEMNALAYEGAAQIRLEFEPTANMDQALVDIREAVDKASSEYPAETLEPVIEEFNAQQMFPIISITLSGDAPDRTLYQTADRLQKALQNVQGVLEVDLVGNRDEVLEVVIDPDTLQSYGLSAQEVAASIRNNNSLITAGSIRFSDGAYAVKLPGLIRSVEEMQSIPVRSDGQNVVLLADVADIRRTFEDPDGYAQFNGESAVGLNVSKRSGANIIEMTEGVKRVTEEMAASSDWPGSIRYEFIGDQSYFVDTILKSLTASIVLAILLVMIVVVAALGLRSAVMVGFAIPSSFLIGLALLNLSGYTLNMMTMFAMVLSVGMLVDGAIVVVEFADRRMTEGASRRDAYASAAKRMFWPIVASTATTLAAFVPFLFWQDVPGQFMRLLPITLIFILTGSVFVALIFLPLFGSFFAIPEAVKKRLHMKGKTDSDKKADFDSIDPTTLQNITGRYARFIRWILRKPLATLVTAFIVLNFCIFMFSNATPESEFFIRGDSEQTYINIQGRGNISEEEKLQIANEVREKVDGHYAIESIYTQTGPALSRGNNSPVETIAQLNIELTHYEDREHSLVILEEFRELTAGLPGIVLEIGQPENGPPIGKDVQVEIVAEDEAKGREAARLIREFVNQSTVEVNGLEVPTYIDIEDNRPLPGIEWALQVDREQAGRFGVSVDDIGAAIQLVTDGLLIDKFRPDDSDEEIDIRIRYPADERTIAALEDVKIQTQSGPLPISNFVERVAQPQVDRVTRRDSRRVLDVKANGNTNVSGHQVSQDLAISVMQEWLDTGELAEAVGPGVSWALVGSTEERDEASTFFAGAMAAAMFMIGLILLLQFNSFYHAALTLSAVVLSVFGVLLGIALTGQYISVIMTGTGIVALAGIVVNNNIVLIDTYQHLRKTGLSIEEAVIRTAAQRARPVLMTTITTIMGLLPMVFEINVNFLTGQIGIGNAVSDWWVLLSSAVVYGLAFSTLLTLVLTPVMLAAPSQIPANVMTAWREIRDWINELRGHQTLQPQLQGGTRQSATGSQGKTDDDYHRTAAE